MKRIYGILIMLLVALVLTVSCSSSGQNKNNGQVIVNQVEPNVGDNLDLRAVGEIVKTSKGPQEIEQRLNADDGVNNLDLDGDGTRDYLKVTEYGQGSEHGYSICAVLSDGEPEVANVIIDKSSKEMHLNGNPTYYGNNNTYHSTISPSEMLLLAYLMRPNYAYYHSPYYYGHYGYGFGPRPVVHYNSYHTRSVVRTSTTRSYSVPKTRTQHTIKSPNSSNHSNVAAKRTSNFSNATKSQKSFQKTTPSNGPRNTSGFANKPASSPQKSAVRPPATTKSSSGYSSPTKSKSSSSGFGSSSRSSSRSSSSSSRSSSSSSSSKRR